MRVTEKRDILTGAAAGGSLEAIVKNGTSADGREFKEFMLRITGDDGKSEYVTFTKGSEFPSRLVELLYDNHLILQYTLNDIVREETWANDIRLPGSPDVPKECWPTEEEQARARALYGDD